MKLNISGHVFQLIDEPENYGVRAEVNRGDTFVSIAFFQLVSIADLCLKKVKEYLEDCVNVDEVIIPGEPFVK